MSGHVRPAAMVLHEAGRMVGPLGVAITIALCRIRDHFLIAIDLTMLGPLYFLLLITDPLSGIWYTPLSHLNREVIPIDPASVRLSMLAMPSTLYTETLLH